MGDSIRRSMLLLLFLRFNWHWMARKMTEPLWFFFFSCEQPRTQLPQLRRWHQQQQQQQLIPVPKHTNTFDNWTERMSIANRCVLLLNRTPFFVFYFSSSTPKAIKATDRENQKSCFNSYTQGNRIKSQLIWHLNHGSYASTAAADDTRQNAKNR